jgi:hypothetical protein
MVVVNDLNGGLVGEAEWSVCEWAGCWKVVSGREGLKNKNNKTKTTMAIGVCGVAVAVKAGKAGPRMGLGPALPPT